VQGTRELMWIKNYILSHLSANRKDDLKRLLATLNLYETPPEQIYLERLVALQPSTFIVQIGANDGEDFVRSVVRRYGRGRNISGTLVEPQLHFYNKLLRNYAGTKGIDVLNVAISDRAKSATLYYVDYGAGPGWAKGLGSFSREVVLSHGHLISGLAQSIKTIEVACISVPELLAKLPNAQVDVLVTDTEGHDFVILRQFDFARVRPKLVVFESKHLSDEELVGCEAMFSANGYYVVHLGNDNSLALRSDMTELLSRQHASSAIPPARHFDGRGTRSM
jgi:FkbM family methyltransferase